MDRYTSMKERKSIFFTSDLHIGHLNSIKFDQRPFRDLDHMHEVLINNYNLLFLLEVYVIF
jgi:calcineurin-like phosphoesterase family protein